MYGSVLVQALWHVFCITSLGIVQPYGGFFVLWSVAHGVVCHCRLNDVGKLAMLADAVHPITRHVRLGT